jgi:hypothetical protein
MKTLGIKLGLVFSWLLASGFGQTIFTESMGIVGGTTAIAVHEAANGFDNTSYTMSGTGDLRATSVSSGYSGASGGANVFLTNNGSSNFQIAGISSISCSDLTLTFGAFKSTTASDMSELLVEFSTDGVTYIPISIPAQPTGSGTANWRLITLNLPPAAANQTNLRLRWTNTASGSGLPQFRIDDVSLIGSCGNISIDAISSLTYVVDCNNGDVGSIDFSTTGSFNLGNEFQVELSDASGSFTSPIIIGALSGSPAEGVDPSGTIAFDIPAVMPSGSEYRVRMTSTDPVQTSTDNGTDISITLMGSCVPPHITSLIINACNSICSEGDNEMFFGNTGDYSMDFTADNTNVFYGSTPSPTTNFTTSVHDLPSTTIDFNTNAGCPGLFVDAFNTVVPPNSSFMLAHVDVCPLDVIDFTNLCGTGPIYVVYVDAPSWSSGGNFVNTPACSGGTRYLTSVFVSTVNVSHEIDFFFECAFNSGNTGDFAVWDENGGAPLLQDNDGCAFPPSVLPISLLNFSANHNGYDTELEWETASEQDNDYFLLSHSLDGKNFSRIAKIPGSGNTDFLISYAYTHLRTPSGINYYKLRSVDFDGTIHEKGIVAVVVEMEYVFYNQLTGQIFFPNAEKSYAVYDLTGRQVLKSQYQNEVNFTNKGIYLVVDEFTGKAIKIFVN